MNALHELKLIVDLFYEGGLNLMNYSVSETAEYGGYSRGAKVLPLSVKENMKQVLTAVQDQSFAKEYLADARGNQSELKKYREENSQHAIERIGKKLRSHMSWLQDKIVETRKVG